MRSNKKKKTVSVSFIKNMLIGGVLVSLLLSSISYGVVYPESLLKKIEEGTNNFVSIDGFDPIDFNQSDDYYSLERFPELKNWNSAFNPDSDMNAVEHLLIKMAFEEGEIPFARYKVEYQPVNYTNDEGYEAHYAHLQITRFNMGPALHKELVESYGEYAAPMELFSPTLEENPHIIWRVAVSSIMGWRTYLVTSSRKVLTADEAEMYKCFEISCLATDRVIGPLGNWQILEIPPNYDTPSAVLYSDSDNLYLKNRRGAFAGGVLLRHAIGEGITPFGEPSEGVPEGEFQIIMVISNEIYGSGEPLTSGVMQQRYLMDDELSELWNHRAQIWDMAPYWYEMGVLWPSREAAYGPQPKKAMP